LAVWLVGGSWFYACKVLGLCDNIVAVLPKVKKEIQILDPKALQDAYGSIFNAEEGLKLKLGLDTLILSPSFERELDHMANFLKENTDTKLTVTGCFSSEEDNRTSFPDLGLARAAKIKKLLIDREVDNAQLLSASIEKEQLFSEQGFAENNEVIDFKFSEDYDELNENDVKSAFKAARVISSEALFESNEENIHINKKMDDAIMDLVYYFNRSKDQHLKVSVDFEKEERAQLPSMNDSLEFEMGEYRAFNFKRSMLDRGLSARDRAEIEGVEKDTVFNKDGQSLAESLRLTFRFPDKSKEYVRKEMALERALEKQLSNRTRTLFPKGSATPKLDEDELAVNVDALNAFLSNYNNKIVHIIGHTCDEGEEENNESLGMARAVAVREALHDAGFDRSFTKVFSVGATHPRYANSDPKGNSLNRRVEIDIVENVKKSDKN